jgi:hypothetical protein
MDVRVAFALRTLQLMRIETEHALPEPRLLGRGHREDGAAYDAHDQSADKQSLDGRSIPAANERTCVKSSSSPAAFLYEQACGPLGIATHRLWEGDLGARSGAAAPMTIASAMATLLSPAAMISVAGRLQIAVCALLNNVNRSHQPSCTILTL